MHALAHLMRRRQADDPSLTYRRIAEIAGDISGSTIGNWATESTEKLSEIPRPDSIMSLARGLSVRPYPTGNLPCALSQ